MRKRGLMRQTFKRDLGSLEGIFAFLCRFFAEETIDSRHFNSVNLAIEELFTNMVKYHPENPNEISVSLCRVGDELHLSLTDFDVDAFDVTQADAGLLPGELGDRTSGGMGLRLVRQMMDGVVYDYKNRESRITVIKNLR
jgi:serine/threonine-protein kinase RsbW